VPPAAARPAYHHGDLRRALLETGVELARERGPSAVTVREAARRVGVSPSAAYRHFAAHSDLLAVVAAAALQELAARMRAAIAAAKFANASSDDASSDSAHLAALTRFRAVGLAYVEFALDSPGLFRTAYSADAPVDPLPDAAPDADHPRRILGEMLDGLVAVGTLLPERRRHADAAAWSGVHGLAVLVLDGLLSADGTDQQALVDSTLDMIGVGLCAPALFGPDA
jgi:AcrR family transcriptional regulator